MIIRATETTGTTTATAIVPPADRPPDPLESPPEGGRADGLADVVAARVAPMEPCWVAGEFSEAVDVMIRVVAGTPFEEAFVITDVTTVIEEVGGGALEADDG
jgi:hypothetical protein